MIKHLFLLAFLICSPLWSTTYYVSNTGSDAANGTTTSTPWQTVAKVNGLTFSAGDSILFQAGGTWRELLTVPSSGSAGSPITIGSYGTGAAPIISGANLLTGWSSTVWSGWHHGGGAQNVGSSPLALSVTPPRGSLLVVGCHTFNTSTIVISDNSSGPTDSWTTVKAATAWNSPGTVAAFAAVVTNGTPPTTVTCTGGSTGYVMWEGADWYTGNLPTVSMDGTAAFTSGVSTSPAATFTTGVSSPGDLLWSFAAAQGTATAVASPFTIRNVGSYNLATADDGVTGGVAANTAQTATYTQSNSYYAEIIAGFQPTSLTATLYYASLVSQPQGVFENGTRMAIASSEGGLVSGSWWWDAANTRVYIYPTGDVNPSTETIEVQTRADCILNNKNYTTIQGIICQGASSGIYLGGTHSILTNSTVRHIVALNGSGSPSGTAIIVGGSNQTIQSTVVSDAEWGISGYVPSGTSTGNLIQNNYVNNIDYDCINFGASGGTLTNTTIQYNETAFCGQGFNGGYLGFGVVIDANSGGMVARYNYAHDVGTAAHLAGGALGIQLTGANNTVWYGNVATHNYGIGFAAYVGTGNVFYNNTLYNNGVATSSIDGEVVLSSGASGNTVKNNLICPTPGAVALYMDSSSESGAVIDYNNYCGTSSTQFVVVPTSYTFSGWKTQSSQDAHSINTAPTFYNATAGQLWLTAGSPGIAAGTALGAPYNTGIYPGSSWPVNVFLIPNLNNDLGAFPYTGYVIDSVMGSGIMR